MAHADDSTKPHSAEYFGEGRDYWWNADFLALIARRWAFDQITSVLDVGCGVGHWGRVLLPHLPAAAHVTGIDPEAQWVKVAESTAATKGIGHRTRYVQGTAEHIPFPDDSFDLVTCQTVLIHVRDCRVALREMIRVLRPGGLLLAAEPNNQANSMLSGTTRLHETVDDRMRLVRFQAICERGKEQLGEGYNSVGDMIPGLMAEAGLSDVQAFVSDRASPMIPPYAEPWQRAERDQCIEWAGRDFWIWSKVDTHRYFLAGGGTEPEFEPLWQHAMHTARIHAEALRNQTYHAAGGAMQFLISGRKPSLR